MLAHHPRPAWPTDAAVRHPHAGSGQPVPQAAAPRQASRGTPLFRRAVTEPVVHEGSCFQHSLIVDAREILIRHIELQPGTSPTAAAVRGTGADEVVPRRLHNRQNEPIVGFDSA